MNTSIYSVVLMTLITILTTAFTGIITNALTNFPRVFKIIKNFLNGKKYKCVINQRSIYSDGNSTNNGLSENTRFIMDAILSYIVHNNIISKESCAKLDLSNKILDRDMTIHDEYENTDILYYPKSEIKVTESLFIKYEEDTFAKEKFVEINKNLMVSSKKSEKEIKDFIKLCYDHYNDKLHKKSKDVRYCFKLISCKNNRTIYNRSDISDNRTTFDDIFFPQKDDIIYLLNKLKSNQLKKLGLLLYGEPGTGKTSLIKAIANFTKMHIIDVKLSTIKNDKTLENIFLNNKISSSDGYLNCGEELYTNNFINNSNRIYVFEDIDAECEIVEKRTINALPEMPITSTENEYKKIKDLLKSSRIDDDGKLTLSGLLNVLDGIIELNGSIIIMTTNHIEKLDPAIIRHGRVNARIHLKKMRKSDADKMIFKYYKKELKNDIIKDDIINPSDLEALCQQCNDINILENKIKEIIL